MKITQPFNVTQFASLMGGAQEAGWKQLIALLRDMYTAMTTNLTLGDNFVGLYFSASITTQPTYLGGDFNPIVIPWPYASKKIPQSCIIAQVVNPSNQQDRLLSAVTCQSWSYDSLRQVVTVPYITGLNNSAKYVVVFKVE